MSPKPTNVELHVQYSFHVRGREFGIILRALRSWEKSPQAKAIADYMEKQRHKQAQAYLKALEADASESLRAELDAGTEETSPTRDIKGPDCDPEVL